MFIDTDSIISNSIDLNRELIAHPSATFFAKIKGDGMADMGVEDGDIILIDRALDPTDGSLVVCYIENEFLLRRVTIRGGFVSLDGSNGQSLSLDLSSSAEIIWGVVSYCIKDVRHSRL